MGTDNLLAQLSHNSTNHLNFLLAPIWDDPKLMTGPSIRIFGEVRQLLEKSSRIATQVGIDPPVMDEHIDSYLDHTLGSCFKTR